MAVEVLDDGKQVDASSPSRVVEGARSDGLFSFPQRRQEGRRAPTRQGRREVSGERREKRLRDGRGGEQGGAVAAGTRTRGAVGVFEPEQAERVVHRVAKSEQRLVSVACSFTMGVFGCFRFRAWLRGRKRARLSRAWVSKNRVKNVDDQLIGCLY